MSVKYHKNEVFIKLCRFHCHKKNASLLSKELKDMMALKLELGIQPKIALEQINRENPQTVVTMQDLRNIANSQNINSTSLHENDKISTSNLCKNLGDCAVIVWVEL